MVDAWGNYGAADKVSHLCGFTLRVDPPTDEGYRVAPITAAGRALLAARAAQQANTQTHDVQLAAFACLTCGREDGRTAAGALTCHDCAENETPLTGDAGKSTLNRKG